MMYSLIVGLSTYTLLSCVCGRGWGILVFYIYITFGTELLVGWYFITSLSFLGGSHLHDTPRAMWC